jgi:hypothetical protein
VIIINADKIALTGNKMGKELYSHSGRPGGLRRDSYAELLKNKPERIIKHAVKGMLPKNKSGQGPAGPSPHRSPAPSIRTLARSRRFSRSLRSRSRQSEPKGDKKHG